MNAAELVKSECLMDKEMDAEMSEQQIIKTSQEQISKPEAHFDKSPYMTKSRPSSHKKDIHNSDLKPSRQNYLKATFNSDNRAK